MTTATAQAFANIAFIKYWGIVTKNIAAVTLFAQFLDFKTRRPSHAYTIKKKPDISLKFSRQSRVSQSVYVNR